MTFVLAVSQAPHFSPYNGLLTATSRQYWIRPSQVTWTGPLIDAGIVGIASNELRQIKVAPAGAFTAYAAEPANFGTPYATVDWTPFNAWHAGTEQVIHGGKRRVNKITIYSDVTGEYREEWQPRHPADYGVGGHWYGETATNGAEVLLYDRLYNPTTESWSERLPQLPGGNTTYIWLPNYGTAGGWMWGQTTLKVYDVALGTVATFGSIGYATGHEIKCYHPAHDKVLVVGGSDSARSVLIDGTSLAIENRSPCPLPCSMSGGTTIIPHPSGCWWVLSADDISPRQMAVYWHASDTWQVLPQTWPRTKPFVHPTTAWDADRQIVLYTDGDGLFAYKLPDVTDPSGAVAISPQGATAHFSGAIPGIGQPRALSPVAGQVQATGHTPAVLQGDAQAVTPQEGHAQAHGYAPTLSQPITLSPANASIVATGYAPAVDQTASVRPQAGRIAAHGYAPTIGQAQTIAPARAQAVAAGHAPIVIQGVRIDPQTGRVEFAGHAPTIAQGGAHTVAPAVGHVRVRGWAPVVTAGVTPDTLPIDAYIAAYLNPPTAGQATHGHDYMRLGERFARRRGLI